MRWLAILFTVLTSAAFAQVAPKQTDETILEQLVPESFKLTASATAQRTGIIWRTAISYALKNDSGMNLYMGVDRSSVAFGTCNDAESSTGGLPLLPSPEARVYSAPAGSVAPRGVMALAGSRVSGVITLAYCDAPNPGSATAPLSMSLLLGKQPDFRSMTPVPISADIPIKQIADPW